MLAKIKDFPNYSVNKEGYVTNNRTGHTLKPVVRNGYFSVRLSKDNKLHHKSLHKLVYESFVSKVPPGMHINHINGLKYDNSLNNLEVCTPKENNERRLNLSKGEQVNTAKLTAEQVMDIRRRKSKGERSLDLAKRYGVGKGHINRIVSGALWKHLPVLSVDKSFWGDPTKTGAISGKSLNEKYGADYFAKIALGRKFKKHCKTCLCE